MRRTLSGIHASAFLEHLVVAVLRGRRLPLGRKPGSSSYHDPTPHLTTSPTCLYKIPHYDQSRNTLPSSFLSTVVTAMLCGVRAMIHD
ncbi:hypothetical protein EXIGLDRAFT_736633 [Exidia glandulosa HHB12029]|uniref:Uncharacterized protein n=1 Tax=Exidia glandulosa HHB12029 TaxID=1314781 RepID=A0A165JBH9_EXIGL|nr:hypothetical protein EXIGLDRAFT_736633 [Exidia glandulosa HHB12029]